MINIYSSPTCKKCKVLKQWCGENNIEFIEIDSNNPEVKDKLLNSKIRQLPIVEINNELVSGELSFLKKIIKGEK